VIGQQDQPLVRRQHHTARAWSLRLLATRIFLSSPIDVGTSIEGMLEHGLERCPIGTAPDQFPFARPLPHAHAQLDLVVGQVADQPAQGAQVFKGAKDEPDDLLHLFIWVELNFSRGAPDVADGQGELQFATPGFAQPPLVHALLQDMQFGFRHRSFQTKQEAVIVLRRVVHPIQVSNQGVKEGAQLQELMPVLVRACQPRHLYPEDHPDVIQAHL
jgi:hypothetical protein